VFTTRRAPAASAAEHVHQSEHVDGGVAGRFVHRGTDQVEDHLRPEGPAFLGEGGAIADIQLYQPGAAI
jgi:hypothetical protein